VLHFTLGLGDQGVLDEPGTGHQRKKTSQYDHQQKAENNFRPQRETWKLHIF
jgi:hypothetical protein